MSVGQACFTWPALVLFYLSLGTGGISGVGGGWVEVLTKYWLFEVVVSGCDGRHERHLGTGMAGWAWLPWREGVVVRCAGRGVVWPRNLDSAQNPPVPAATDMGLAWVHNS